MTSRKKQMKSSTFSSELMSLAFEYNFAEKHYIVRNTNVHLCCLFRVEKRFESRLPGVISVAPQVLRLLCVLIKAVGRQWDPGVFWPRRTASEQGALRVFPRPWVNAFSSDLSLASRSLHSPPARSSFGGN